MKIAFVYDAVYPWVKGGAEKRIYEIGKRLVEQGNEVHVFGVKWWQGARRVEKDGMVLHGVCAPMELYVNGRRSIGEAIFFSIELLPHLIRERFDVIDVSAFPYFPCFCVKLVSALMRTPMIITWHEVWSDYWYEYMGRWGFFGKQIEILVSKLSYRSISVSEMTKRGLESLHAGAPRTGRGTIEIVPNGIDIKGIAEIKRSANKCDVIFVGRLIKEKNVDVLLEAVDRLRRTLPDVKCYILGEGPERERLSGVVLRRGLSDNIGFFGFMEHDEVIAMIKSSKVLVLPSSREGFGLVVLEAFGCGVPVVTVRSSRNAARELVDGETGIVADLDAGELARAFLKLLNDSALRERMASSAVEKAQAYDWDRIAGRLACIYEELVKTRK